MSSSENKDIDNCKYNNKKKKEEEENIETYEGKKKSRVNEHEYSDNNKERENSISKVIKYNCVDKDGSMNSIENNKNEKKNEFYTNNNNEINSNNDNNKEEGYSITKERSYTTKKGKNKLDRYYKEYKKKRSNYKYRYSNSTNSNFSFKKKNEYENSLSVDFKAIKKYKNYKSKNKRNNSNFSSYNKSSRSCTNSNFIRSSYINSSRSSLNRKKKRYDYEKRYFRKSKYKYEENFDKEYRESQYKDSIYYKKKELKKRKSNNVDDYKYKYSPSINKINLNGEYYESSSFEKMDHNIYKKYKHYSDIKANDDKKYLYEYKKDKHKIPYDRCEYDSSSESKYKNNSYSDHKRRQRYFEYKKKKYRRRKKRSKSRKNYYRDRESDLEEQSLHEYNKKKRSFNSSSYSYETKNKYENKLIDANYKKKKIMDDNEQPYDEKEDKRVRLGEKVSELTCQSKLKYNDKLSLSISGEDVDYEKKKKREISENQSYKFHDASVSDMNSSKTKNRIDNKKYYENEEVSKNQKDVENKKEQTYLQEEKEKELFLKEASSINKNEKDFLKTKETKNEYEKENEDFNNKEKIYYERFSKDYYDHRNKRENGKYYDQCSDNKYSENSERENDYDGKYYNKYNDRYENENYMRKYYNYRKHSNHYENENYDNNYLGEYENENFDKYECDYYSEYSNKNNTIEKKIEYAKIQSKIIIDLPHDANYKNWLNYDSDTPDEEKNYIHLKFINSSLRNFVLYNEYNNKKVYYNGYDDKSTNDINFSSDIKTYNQKIESKGISYEKRSLKNNKEDNFSIPIINSNTIEKESLHNKKSMSVDSERYSHDNYYNNNVNEKDRKITNIDYYDQNTSKINTSVNRQLNKEEKYCNKINFKNTLENEKKIEVDFNGYSRIDPNNKDNFENELKINSLDCSYNLSSNKSTLFEKDNNNYLTNGSKNFVSTSQRKYENEIVYENILRKENESDLHIKKENYLQNIQSTEMNLSQNNNEENNSSMVKKLECIPNYINNLIKDMNKTYEINESIDILNLNTAKSFRIPKFFNKVNHITSTENFLKFLEKRKEASKKWKIIARGILHEEFKILFHSINYDVNEAKINYLINSLKSI